MIIKKETIKKRNSYFPIVKFLYLYFFLSLAVISILVILVFKSEKFSQEKKFFLDYLSKGGRYEYLYLPNIFFNALRSNFYHLEKINLEIPFEKIIILENFRKESIANGKLPKTSSIPRIKAKIIYNENEFDSDLRLKGDRRPHFFDKEKSSYKLELDKDQYIFGIKKFSLQKPRIRNYIHEWIFHELSGDEDIIKIKYDFLNLSINGDNKGLYVIEEGFGKELIERNKRRNGPIFSLNEDFTDRITGLEGLIDGKPIFEIYNKKFWQKPENNLIANIASQKLREFFEDKLSINEVFDLKKWAAYFAIIDLTATYHGALLKSVRLYYNPLNGLFEPIPYDGHRLKPNYNKYNMNYDNRILIDRVQNPKVNEKISRVYYNLEWLKKFFYSNQEINKNFYDLYSFYLNKISSEKYVDAFLSKNIDKIREINSHIYADYFFYDDSQTYGFGLYYFLISDFKYQAANIRNKLKFKDDAQLLKISENNYLFKPFYKNYNQIIAKKFKCIDGDNEVEIKISQDLKNFEETYLKIDSNKTNNLVCNSLVLFDKLSNKDFLLNVDNLNSKFNYKNFKRENSNFFLNYFEKKKSNLILKNNIVEISENIYIP